MKVARYWIRETAETLDRRGGKLRAAAWGWSAANVEEARERALASAQRVLQWLANQKKGTWPRDSGQYTYCADRPPREEIVQEFHDAAGDVSSLITRNGYGSLVLNSRDLMFIDVDFSVPPPAPVRFLAGLFGRKSDAAPNSEAAALDRMRAWCATHSDVGVRIYRTAAGFRAAIVDRPHQAEQADARSILDEFGADPLYRRLCEVQQCFRARLTPKPWRMGLRPPTARFPFADAAVEGRYRDWQRQYDAAAPKFATCRFLESHGPSQVHADISPLLALHDSLTGSEKPMPLA